MKITLQNVTMEKEAVMWMIVVFGIVNRQIQMKRTRLSVVMILNMLNLCVDNIVD